MRSLLTPRQVASVLRQFGEGKSVAQIAARLNVPRDEKERRNLVYKRLAMHGLKVVGSPSEVMHGAPPRYDHLRPKAVALYRKGVSMLEISRRIGISYTRTHEFIEESGFHRNHHTGRTRSSFGYVMVKVPGRKGYVAEHRYVMEQHLGRPLDPEETVHHINGDRTDNRLENLQLRKGRHGRGVTYRCRKCGSFDVEAVPVAEGNA